MTARKKKAVKRPASKGTGRVLTALQILSAKDCEPVRVDCPEWGGHVYIKPMNGAERDEFDQDQWASMQAREASGDKSDNIKNLRARTIAACACDKAGTLVFTMSQVAALGLKNGAVLDRLFTQARGLNKLSDEDVKELVGN